MSVGVERRHPRAGARSLFASGHLGLRSSLAAAFWPTSWTYNAGPGAVGRCGCIPPYPETRGYSARILGLLSGAGDPTALTGWRCGS
jgi:hypothetical protein